MENLIKKYEPKTLDDFTIQTSIISILKNLIEINLLSLLIIGNNNTGKSTILKSIIKLYDKEDVMIVNTLTDQSINYCRNDLKIFCKSTSTKKYKKLVVLDDIDFINRHNQQILRNYIDKYKDKVNFLCTGKCRQKIIESIQSRLMILKLEDITVSNLNHIFNYICKNEKITISDNGKKFIINNCGNSIQNMITNIEKIKLLNIKNVDLDTTINICTNMNYNNFKTYMDLCLKRDLYNSIKKIYFIYDSGYSVIDILDNFFVFIKNTDLITDTIKYKIIKLICKYITNYYNYHENEMELVLFTNELINLFN